MSSLTNLMKRMQENDRKFQQIFSRAAISTTGSSNPPKVPQIVAQPPNLQNNVRRQLFESSVSSSQNEHQTPIKMLQELQSQNNLQIHETLERRSKPQYVNDKRDEKQQPSQIVHCPCCQHYNQTPKTMNENRNPNPASSSRRLLNSSFPLRTRVILDDIQEVNSPIQNLLPNKK